MYSLFDSILQAIAAYIVILCIYVGLPVCLFYPIDVIVGGMDESVLMHLYLIYCIIATVAIIGCIFWYIKINSKEYKEKKLKEMQEKLSQQSVKNFEEFQRLRQHNYQSKKL